MKYDNTVVALTVSGSVNIEVRRPIKLYQLMAHERDTSEFIPGVCVCTDGTPDKPSPPGVLFPSSLSLSCKDEIAAAEVRDIGR